MSMSSSILYPAYYQVVQFDGKAWGFKRGKTFLNPTCIPLPCSPDKIDYFQLFGLTPRQLILEFRFLNGGKVGYYIANMRDRDYYYCGHDWEDVRTTFQTLGIGRPDPVYEVDQSFTLE
jgi:hypothetical protein